MSKKMNRKESERAALSAGMMPDPLSAEQLEAMRSSLRWRAAAARRACAPLSLAALVSVPFVAAMAGRQLMAHFESMGANGDIAWALSFFFALILFVIFVTGVVAPLPKPMRKIDCEEMGEALKSLPNGEAFRAAVLAQGREFTEIELAQARRAKKAHAENIAMEKQKKSCCELYGVER